MHVLFVTGEYPPLAGGVGAYTAELACALTALGARVTVLTTARAAQEGVESAHTEPPVALLPVVRRWGPRVSALCAEVATSLGADWVHVQYQTAAFAMNPAINLAPDRWRRLSGRRWRTAWTCHDLLPPYLFPKAGDRLRSWITERPARVADLAVVTNEGDWRRLAGRALNLQQIPIGSNIRGLHLTDAERRAVRQHYGYADDDVVLAYFGFLNRSKGGLTLVRTLRQIVDSGVNARLLMIGDPLGASDATNRAYLAEVTSLIAELDLAQRVRWSGRLADDAVSAALNSADILLQLFEDGASLRRGTLMAGLANGCAIVTTEPQAPLPELVGGRDLLYVPRGDAAATARAVRTLLEDDALAATLRANARARSLLFTWESIARRHSELYAQPS